MSHEDIEVTRQLAVLDDWITEACKRGAVPILTGMNGDMDTVGSAIALIIHSIFLGIKFDNDLYKLFRRVVLLAFIIFEIIAQGLLVYNFLKLRKEIKKLSNNFVLKLKVILVSALVIVAIASVPILITKGNTHFKHALEWNYFVGVILFYLLSRFFWRRTT